MHYNALSAVGPYLGVGGVKPGAIDLHHPLLGAASLLQQPVMVQADQTPHQSSLASMYMEFSNL